MADDIDRANEVAQDQLDRLLDKAPKFNEPSYPECMECDADIPYERQKLGGIKLCIDCQTVEERKR